MYWIDLRKGRNEPMKKYIDYETLRQILKERQIVRDTPDRRDEIGGIIFLIDNMAETNEHEELNEELEKLGKELLDGCRKYWQKRINRVTQRAQWIPVTPETMPPYESATYMYSEDTTLIIRRSGQLLIRAVCNSQELLYTGYYEEKEWYSCVDEEIKTLPENVNVTHWMSAKELLKGVEDNAEIH
jgi:hypothetical protein